MLQNTPGTELEAGAAQHGLAVLLDRWSQSGDFDDAFRATYGLTMGQFEEDWRPSTVTTQILQRVPGSVSTHARLMPTEVRGLYQRRFGAPE